MNAVVKRTPAEWKSFFESEEFVENFTYEGDDLGVSVKKDEQLVTEWKLWAPTAMEVSLELFSRGSSREHGSASAFRSGRSIFSHFRRQRAFRRAES